MDVRERASLAGGLQTRQVGHVVEQVVQRV